MYASYLYIFRAFDTAAASSPGPALSPERENADGRRPDAAAVNRFDSPLPTRPDSRGVGLGPAKSASFAVQRLGNGAVPTRRLGHPPGIA